MQNTSESNLDLSDSNVYYDYSYFFILVQELCFSDKIGRGV